MFFFCRSVDAEEDVRCFAGAGIDLFSGCFSPSAILPLDRLRTGSQSCLFDPVADRRTIDYLRYHSEAAATLIVHFARVAKEVFRRNLVGILRDGGGAWYMDCGGNGPLSPGGQVDGWSRDEGLMANFAAMQRLATAMLKRPDRGTDAEIALILSDEGVALRLARRFHTHSCEIFALSGRRCRG
jgi:hypothetical protein